MNREIQTLHRPHTFAEAQTITILGGKFEEGGNIRHADVSFADMQGNSWYFSIMTGKEYMQQAFETWRYEEYDNGSTNTEEPPALVWTGGALTQETIHEIVSDATLEFLSPYLIHINDDRQE